MITYYTGDLLNDDAYALVNTVNTVGVMGKGIALAFKKEFPHNYHIYRGTCLQNMVRIGKLLVVPDHNPALGDRIIVNMPTKRHWRNPSTYSIVEKGLTALRDCHACSRLWKWRVGLATDQADDRIYLERSGHGHPGVSALKIPGGPGYAGAQCHLFFLMAD